MKTLTFRLKGGPGSGAHGHKGIPGHWGGGLPVGEASSEQSNDDKSISPEDISAFNNLVNMFKVNSKVNAAKNEVEMANDSANRYDKLWLRERTEGNRKMRLDAFNKLDEAKTVLYNVRQELKIASKNIKAPGYGEWKITKNSKALAGSWTYYSHPDHPEWGEVGIYSFGGYSMQRVAASSDIEYNGSKFHWSGSGARDSANAFARSVFGIGL
jgi:hypothetical protein